MSSCKLHKLSRVESKRLHSLWWCVGYPYLFGGGRLCLLLVVALVLAHASVCGVGCPCSRWWWMLPVSTSVLVVDVLTSFGGSCPCFPLVVAVFLVLCWWWPPLTSFDGGALFWCGGCPCPPVVAVGAREKIKNNTTTQGKGPKVCKSGFFHLTREERKNTSPPK